MVKYPRIGSRGAGAQGEGRQGAAEVFQPCGKCCRGDEVDFIEDQDQWFRGGGGEEPELSFKGEGASRQRVTGVKNVEEDVGGLKEGV